MKIDIFSRIGVSIKLVKYYYYRQELTYSWSCSANKDINVDRNESEGNRIVCSCPQTTTSKSLTVSMKQQREQREIKGIEKTTEGAREDYEGLLIYQ